MVDIDIGDYELDQDSNDDLVIKDPNDNEVMKWDKSAGEWNFGSEALANIGSIANAGDITDSGNSTTVYDSSAEKVGDGNQNADINDLLVSDVQADSVSTGVLNTDYVIDAGDYADIQSALNDASSKEIPLVVIPPGEYTISSTLEVPDNVRMTGFGSHQAQGSRAILNGDPGVDPVVTSKTTDGIGAMITEICINPDSTEDAFNGSLTSGYITRNRMLGRIKLADGNNDGRQSEISHNKMNGQDITVNSNVESSVLITANKAVGTITSNNATEGTNT